MLDERRIFAALAVLLIAYALVALLAYGASGTRTTFFRRLWRRISARRGDRPR
jgi:hypothetical protein